MDYASIHGNDISNFSSSESPHRMPTVSAAKALEELESPANTLIPTGLTDFDRALRNQYGRNDAEGGVLRGHVTEIYGPPGVGKTAFGMQIAACVLNKGQKAVWIDSGHPLPYQRLKDIVSSQSTPTKDASSSQSAPTEDEKVSNLIRIATPSLAHLIALLCRPNSALSLPDTTLIVIDSFSTLISNAFPRLDTSVQANSQKPRPGGGLQIPIRPPASRKFPILQHIISSLNTLATVHNIAIVIANGVVTKMRPGLGALLVPAVSGTAWDEGVGTRICLFRDWGMAKIKVKEDDDTKEKDMEVGLRFAGVLKARGVSVGREGGLGKIIPFIITKGGLQEAPAVTSPADVPYLATPTRKRKADEIQDSEDDEDYGWAEDDESEVPIPPQWQGSEDILVPGPEEEEEEEEEEEVGKAAAEKRQETDNKESGKEIPVVADSEEDEEENELAEMDKYTRLDRYLEDYANGAPLHDAVLDEIDAIYHEEEDSVLEAEFTI